MKPGKRIFPVLPLLDMVHSEFWDGVRPLDGVGLFCVQHLLETTGSLFEKLAQLGLSAEQTFIMGKVYSANAGVKDGLEDWASASQNRRCRIGGASRNHN